MTKMYVFCFRLSTYTHAFIHDVVSIISSGCITLTASIKHFLDFSFFGLFGGDHINILIRSEAQD